MLVVLLALTTLWAEQQGKAQFHLSDAMLLVKNMPEAIETKQRGGCIRVAKEDFQPSWKPTLMVFQLRNRCPKGVSGLIGNYAIDLTTGMIYFNPEATPPEPVDSPRLKRLREGIVRRKRSKGR